MITVLRFATSEKSLHFPKKVTLYVIYFPENGQILVGINAVKDAQADPENSVKEVKKLMGQIDPATNEPYVITRRGKKYAAEQLSALILAYIKEQAEEQFGQKIDKAVITVPANFNQRQRTATKN